MKLVLKSKNEMVVSRAIELNEALQTVLDRHDSLLSSSSSSSSPLDKKEAAAEEESTEQLIRRRRKGKTSVNIGTKSDGLDRFDLHKPPPSSSSSSSLRASIPPPPSNRVERERYFRENGCAGKKTGLSTAPQRN